MLVGITGFEPATSSSRTKRATKLRHIPVVSRTVVRGTRNTIPLGFGLAKTAGCVRFVAGVGAWRWRGGGVAAAWRWRGAARCGLDPAPQKTISGFASSFLQKPRSRSGKIAKSRYRLLGSSRDLRRSRQSRRSRRSRRSRQSSGAADERTGRPARNRPARNRPPRNRFTRARRPGSAMRTVGRTGARVRTWTGRARWIPPSTCGRSGAGRRRVRGRCRRW